MAQLALVMMVCLMWLSQPARADTLVLSVPDTQYPPYVVEADGRMQGILLDPLIDAAERAGIRLEFQLLPELRSQRMLERGLIDGRMESPSWIAQPELYLWTTFMLPMRDVLVYHQQHKPESETDDALANYEIVTHLGYAYPELQPWFDQGQAARIDKISERNMLLALLDPNISRFGRAAVMEQGVAGWYLDNTAELQKQPLVFGERLFGCAMMGFQLSNTPEIKALLERLNQHMSVDVDSVGRCPQ
ncbi:hypothetical protein CHH28_02265 [Bacterioplanes sanyensis]|uniref:Solute-binding protein family 3/N-terminal domain-containing protein n=1 Tax=Bacterioplanes sanyensis TaxID=1249553 RepID=A0A222FFP4_9GAMM|nr:hypothetical protein [Bacterioplanes sanyensis]ASP37569.1 hypothetical protein CHH28_02265 [Bacterioplanes sanyensis]